jgi:hypothetical protein
MNRSIDSRRSRELITEQFASINNFPCIIKLKKLINRLPGASKGNQKWKKRQKAFQRLRNEKQRQRALLLRDIIKRYNKKQPVIDNERQLSGKVIDKNVQNALERSDYMTPEHLLLMDAILTLPETSLEKEHQPKIAAINAVTAYCDVKKGISCRRGRPGRPAGNKVSTVIKAEKPAQSWSDTALNQAILSIRTEKKPTIYFFNFETRTCRSAKKSFLFQVLGV